MRKQLPLYLAFLALCALTVLVYSPGLDGGFLFDDAPNLQSLGSLGGIKDWDTFQNFVLHGSAGPLGRPVALASFVLDSTNWPADPWPFKRTNLVIHLFAGLALFWATLAMLRLGNVSDRKSQWAALLNAAFWLLHPYMVSTTLYSVQRMAQLAALFMFLGLAGYLHGRLLLIKGQKSAGYVWISVSIVAGTALAAFSKENGLLLPALILVVEACLPRHRLATHEASFDYYSCRPDWRWRMLFLWLPTMALIAALISKTELAADAWPEREFNQIERLLTQPRILWEYLFHLYVPRIEGRGLFQDGYDFSTGLLQPAITLPAILGLFGLTIGAILVRRKLPWVSLAILFFFVSHLTESTLINLELYFEHRNYAASAFLFLPIVMGLLWVADKRSGFLGYGVMVVLLALLSLFTWQRAKLWGDTEALQTYWAVSTPDSPRAQNHIAVQYFRHGRSEDAMAHLDKAMQRMPSSSLLSMQWLMMRLEMGTATSEDFAQVRQWLPSQHFDAQAILGIRHMVDRLTETPAEGAVYLDEMLELLDTLEELPRYRAVPVFNRLLPYLRGKLMLAQGRPLDAKHQMLDAINQYRETDAALSIVADVANAGYQAQALDLLDAAREVYQTQDTSTLKRSRAVYDMEFQRLKELLEDDVRQRADEAGGGE